MDIYLQSTFELLRQQLTQIDTIQCIVLVFGVTEVLLARANSILLYPAGIISVIFAAYSLFGVGLYAESGLHFYYLVMSVYGWWHWVKKKNEPPVKVSFTTRNDWVITAAIVIGGWLVLYFVLLNLTPSTVPAWDAWISSTGWAGMWLLARRRIENWILLNISNAFAIPLLFQKDLPLFAVLTAFLFVVACIGYFDWIKIYKRDRISLSAQL
jgi:nicotinamide mononucleotide transporter